jgi:hypothetical protein
MHLVPAVLFHGSVCNVAGDRRRFRRLGAEIGFIVAPRTAAARTCTIIPRLNCLVLGGELSFDARHREMEAAWDLITASVEMAIGRFRASSNRYSIPMYGGGKFLSDVWRKIWISFLLSSCSFYSLEEAVIGDIGGGDNP